jgi:YesN/AraC family two-component response regulator
VDDPYHEYAPKQFYIKMVLSTLQVVRDLVLTDLVMPRMTGLEMVDRIVEIEPNAKFLMMSGYSNAALEIQARERLAFIRKPLLPRELIEKVQEVLGHGPVQL